MTLGIPLLLGSLDLFKFVCVEIAWRLMPGKIKFMTNNEQGFSAKIKVSGQKLKLVTQFKYLGSISSEEDSRIK